MHIQAATPLDTLQLFKVLLGDASLDPRDDQQCNANESGAI